MDNTERGDEQRPVSGVDAGYVDAEALKRAIYGGYHDRDDYPPYALAPWDDRNRYREYVIRIIDEMAQST